MNPVAIKLGLVALDQLILWGAAYAKARDNPNMTEIEAGKLIADTQAQTIKISSDWRAYRQGS